jgi:hypothetical protein
MSYLAKLASSSDGYVGTCKHHLLMGVCHQVESTGRLQAGLSDIACTSLLPLEI